jgi:hypothetical protein
MSRRVMLVEVRAQTPGARTYATLNPADKDASLNLTNGNLTAKNANATAVWRAVRSTQGKSSGRWYAEVRNSVNASSSLSVGIATSAASLANYIGSGATGWGIFANDSTSPPRVFNNAASQSATGLVPLAAGQVAMVAVDCHLGKVWLGCNGVWALGGDPAAGLNPTFSFTPGTAVFLALALFGGTQEAIANFGATAFAHQVPQTFNAGWYTTAAATANTLYLASERVVTKAASTPANTLYLPRLLPGSDPVMKRRGSCWVWGGDSARQGVGELEFCNADRGLDGWRNLVFRDARVIVSYGTPTQARDPSTCTVWTEAIAERVEFTAHTVKLILSDKLARLDKPGQTSLYATGVQNTVLVEQPKPTLIGRAANIDPVQINTSTWVYDCGDGNVAIEEITDRGDPFDVGATEFDRLTNGFDLLAAPAGKVAATATGLTGTVVANVLNETFSAWTASAVDPNPTGWNISGEAGSDTHVFESPAGVARFEKNTTYTSDMWIERNLSLSADKVYRIQIDVTAVVAGHLRVFFTTAGGVRSLELFRLNSTGLKTLFARGIAGYPNLRIEVRYPTITDVSITSVVVDEMKVNDRLPDFISECAVTRGGLLAGDLDTTTINALDAKTTYRLGYFSRGQWRIRDVLRQALDSFTGGIYQDRLGRLAVWRLEEPAATPVLSLTTADLGDDWTCKLDTAPGLTTILGALRNWTQHTDADFATSVTQASRERLRAAFGVLRRALDVVDPAYAHADKAAPLATLLTRDLDALLEISRVAWFYGVPRFIYSGTAFLDQSAALTLKPGDTILVTQPKFDMATGKRLLVTGIESRFFLQRVSLECIG